jgi:hypothetical protein
MISHVRSEVSIDNKTLVCVVWERESPDANTPTIEAIYQYRPADWDSPKRTMGVLVLMSVTRKDTRTPIEMTREEEVEVLEIASDYAENHT